MRPIPGGTNVIASAVEVWLDARHASAADTAGLVDEIVAEVREEAAMEGCTVTVHRESMSEQVAFDVGMAMQLSDLLSAPVIPTGAGHDAGILAAKVPSAMMFVRNPSGISHAPGEHAETADCLTGVIGLAEVLAALAG
jgi:N-carbamoyl-L-amino-acid hydrolase